MGLGEEGAASGADLAHENRRTLRVSATTCTLALGTLPPAAPSPCCTMPPVHANYGHGRANASRMQGGRASMGGDVTAISARAMEYFREVHQSAGARGVVGEVLGIIAGGADDAFACANAAKLHGATGEEWYRRECVDLVLGYVKHLVEDATLDAEAVRDVNVLKARLQIRHGDFTQLRPVAVARVLQDQLELLLADGHIDQTEDLYQVELQGMFDLGYDEYLALVGAVLADHWSRMSDQLARVRWRNAETATELEAKLRALEPLYRLAVGRGRGAAPDLLDAGEQS